MCDTHIETTSSSHNEITTKLPWEAKIVSIKFEQTDQAKDDHTSATPNTHQDSDNYWTEVETQLKSRYGKMKASINPLRLFSKNPTQTGYIPAHGFAVIEGQGMVLARIRSDNEAIDPLKPDLLFYAPQQIKKRAYKDVLPDGAYELVGVGYAESYKPNSTPNLAFVDSADWFVHESGCHTRDGGFEILKPESESFLGEKAQYAPDKSLCENPSFATHSRMWDQHVWFAPEGTTFSINMPESLEARLPEKTLELDADAFFYPASKN